IVGDRHKLKIGIDEAAFKQAHAIAADGNFEIQSAEVRLPRMHAPVRLWVALQALLDDLPVRATFRSQGGKVTIYPGSPIPPRDESGKSPLTARLARPINLPGPGEKVPVRDAL